MDNVTSLLWTPATEVPTISEESIQIDFSDSSQVIVTRDTDLTQFSTHLQNVCNTLFNGE